MIVDGAGLEDAWLAAGGQPPTTRFRTTESGIATDHGPVLIAVQDDGLRHLLVPIHPRHTLREELDGRAVTLRRRVLEDESEYRTYAALGLVDDQFRDLFTALCAQVIERISNAPSRAPAALRSALDDWRSLLSGARRTMTPAELAGLFGELSVLRELLALDPGAVAFWTGPSGAAQDFHRGTDSLEVKTSTSPEGRRVRVHGLGQLDGGAGRLLLAWVRLRTDDGRSVPDLVDEISASTDDANTFLSALNDAGFHPSDREVYARRVFTVVEQRTYVVAQGFPRIVPTTLTGDATLAGLDGVHYDLDLDSAPATATIVDLPPAQAFLEVP